MSKGTAYITLETEKAEDGEDEIITVRQMFLEGLYLFVNFFCGAIMPLKNCCEVSEAAVGSIGRV
jgi:hypothetical protein